MELTSNEYTCALCGETHYKGVSDEDAMAETRSTFGPDVQPEDCEVVCEDCWQKIHPLRN